MGGVEGWLMFVRLWEVLWQFRALVPRKHVSCTIIMILTGIILMGNYFTNLTICLRASQTTCKIRTQHSERT